MIFNQRFLTDGQEAFLKKCLRFGIFEGGIPPQYDFDSFDIC